jgi:hypothetical protein
MALATGTFEFDLVPDSGSLPQDEGTWRQVQFHLLEFMAAREVSRLEEPTRIHVIAYGDKGDLVPPGLLARLEERCGTRLRQVTSQSRLQ